MAVSNLALEWTERGMVPDAVVRAGIRRLLRQRLDEIGADDSARAAERREAFVASLSEAPLALLTDKANEQHYELPPAFFAAVLGRHLKYSSGWWPEGVSDLDAAEAAALQATCERAELADGQQVLELGCGWGSLSLWMAERYPGSRITSVSNSHAQRAFIQAEAMRRGLSNLQVLTCDINRFTTDARFDRVVSVEMFEHLRNWPEAFRRVRTWLEPNGRFFMHVFVHAGAPYAFEARDESDWMSRYFFSGGMMPSDDLAMRCQDDLRVLRHWRWDGTHYARTAEAWLRNMDRRRPEVWRALQLAYGPDHAGLWWVRWRLFLMSCAELFAYDRGQQWWVAHYLFAARP
ncbi:MAG TPA: cyclopropane-fatty-acyl-phospholipid synthase family protein [Burkholderiaceae bacterium]|nr:cyclopropane-fatty-acyl-phospholipid synthase family protein [Burkholderiaceae bacterium]